MIEVSAGIVRREDGMLLICQRGKGRNHAHLWEFPGGKREAGESAADTLRRELMEELSLRIRDVREVCVREAEGIRFTFLSAVTQDEPLLTEHEAFAFVRPGDLLHYVFCPADIPVARSLALNNPPLRHFLWDFDGTVMDTYPALTQTVMRAAASLGVELSYTRGMDLMKQSLMDCVQTLSAESGIPTEAFVEAYNREKKSARPEEMTPVEGIPEALARLSALGGVHYLATHRDSFALEALASKDLLKYFKGWVLSSDGFPRKPAPDMLNHLVQTFGFAPAEAVMIGDRPLDVQAGYAAGMRTCLLDEENRFPREKCDLRAHCAAELTELLRPQPL